MKNKKYPEAKSAKYLSLVIVIASLMPVTMPAIAAQDNYAEEVLQNTSWRVVAGAAVGRNPIDTRIDVNHIIRKSNSITFDITGYQGLYHRLQGDCKTRPVRIVRRGLVAGGDVLSGGAFKVNYRPINGSEATQIVKFQRMSLDFACQQASSN